MTSLYILYGSATGNAEQIAKDLAVKTPLPECFSSVICQPLQNFKKHINDWSQDPATTGLGLKKHGLILISSTTGNGDPPENASAFCRYIKRKQTVELQPFQHCAVAVLALGDTNYDKFCETGKVIDSKVSELGAERAMPLACADEATGLEDVVEGWVEQVFHKMYLACSWEGEEEKKEDTETTTTLTPPPTKPLPEKSDTPLYIMYGSATGNSEQIAKDLAANYECLLQNPDALTFFPSVVCCELNQFKKYLPTWEKEENAMGSKHGLLIVASTTGNAEAPENCIRFMSFIKRRTNVTAQPFRNVAFAVLGLGDSNYDVFCATGKEIDKKMTALGGTSAKSLACADEGTGLEDVVDPWTMSVFADITLKCRGAPMTSPSSTTTTVDPKPPSSSSSVKALPPKVEEEEKKSESIVDDMVTVPQPTSSVGVATIKGMLGLSDDSCMLEVPHTLLPSLGANRASCELCHDGFVPPVLASPTDSTEQDDHLYTQSTPYEASVVAARYLTKTSIDAAMNITKTNGILSSLDSFLKSREVIESTFPLQSVEPAVAELNGKRVIEVKMGLPDDNSIHYQPGDTIGLMVPNDSDSVAFVLEALKEYHGILPTQMISIDEKHPITVRQALEEIVDLCGILKNKKTINGLSQFASNNQEAAGLRLLASKDSNGQRLFQEYVVDQRRSFVDILRDFPSCRSITIQGILGLLPCIPPRYYSISSSPLEPVEKPSLSIAFSVVDYLTPSLIVNGVEQGRRRIHGLATSYLEAICSPLLAGAPQGEATMVSKVKLFPKATTHFSLPASVSTPMILIGPGTGIAPFMGFLEHRRAQMLAQRADASDLEGDLGDISVFFGCRHEDHDWLFEDEMKSFLSDGPITNLHTAFSRGKNHKQYVQDLMKQPSTSEGLIDLLLNKGCVVYICGDGNAMAKDVQQAFAEILGKEQDGTSVDLEKGRSEVDLLKKEGRFLLDIWS